MRNHQRLQKALALFALAFMALVPMYAGEKPPTSTSTKPAQMTVTLQLLGENKRMPDVTHEDVIVKQGSERLPVTRWTQASGDRAGLEMFILIDDASDTRLASQYNDLRAFINAQPSTTWVGVGYMRNGVVQIAQELTTDHNQAAKALRLPLASSGAYGSPYLSTINIMKRWPDRGNRREIVMISDGIDRFRGGPRYRSLGFISPDVTSASSVAQRNGMIVHTIFTRGVGRLGNNFWEITNGQNGMSMLSEQTGGQSYYLGTQNPVSIKPYLDDLQRTLDNQYVLEFTTNPGTKAGLQNVKLSTEVAGVELGSADGVWVDAK